MLSLSNNVEINPGLKRNFSEALSICHGNLSSIGAHNFVKLSLLKAYISVHNLDIICICESYLDSETSFNDGSLEIKGYNLICCNHPTKVNHGRVYIYYKDCLPLKVLVIDYLQEIMNFELKMGVEICSFVTSYTLPNQFQDQFKSFSSNFKLSLKKITQKNYLLVVAIQSPTKHLEQSREIQQNWIGPENLRIYFYVCSDCHC